MQAAKVATDLVNSGPDVQVAKGEQLPDTGALDAFLAAHDVELAAEWILESDVAEVRGLRMEAREVLDAPDVEGIVIGAERLTARAGAGPVLLTDGEGRLSWGTRSRPGAAVADELALLVGTGILGVRHHLGRERFRACAAPSCHGVFIDTSRAGRRRYCMPELCGNRVNVSNHRARSRGRE